MTTDDSRQGAMKFQMPDRCDPSARRCVICWYGPECGPFYGIERLNIDEERPCPCRCHPIARLAAEQEASCRLREALIDARAVIHSLHFSVEAEPCPAGSCPGIDAALAAAPGPCVHQQRAEAAESRVRVLEAYVHMAMIHISNDDPRCATFGDWTRDGWTNADAEGPRCEECVGCTRVAYAKLFAAALAGETAAEAGGTA